MSRPTDPFVHTRRITWGETDVARIAYTARFLDFALEAVEAWWHDRVGIGWYEMNVDHGIGTPFVHTEIDYRSPITPRDVLGSTVRLIRRGGSSLHFTVEGRADGRLIYEAKLICAVCQTEPMKPIRAPEAWLPALEAELALSGTPTGSV